MTLLLAARGSTLAAVLAVASSAARAAPEPIFALAYLAPADAGCPSEGAVRAGVDEELGYNPWDPVDDGGSPRIVVEIHAAHGRVRGRIEMRARGGNRLGARELEAATCGELTPALELAIAVAIDPLRAGARPVPSTPALVTATVASAPIAPLVVARPPVHSGFADEVRLRVAFGMQGSVDAAPGPAFGFMGRVGFAVRRWSLAIELRGDLPGGANVDGGRVTASTMAAFLVPCVYHHTVGFCALGGAGGQEVAGSGFLAARSSWVPYAALGGRIEVELPVSRVMSVLLHVDVMAPLTRAELYVGTERPQRVYRSSAISNSFGVALSTR
ncbi:MAG: hypothetical protein JWM53_1215 [bacterium]|nr:hypothetical protein [bacterium]